MTQQLREEEIEKFTKWKIEKIKKDPLERKPVTTREIQKFREETKKK